MQCKIVATASNQIQALQIEAHLRDAGIHCMRSAGGPQSSGGLDVLVAQEDIDRARAALQEAEGAFDEEELARLSEEADRKIFQVTPGKAPCAKNHETSSARAGSAPEAQHRLLKAIERLAKRKPGTNPPENPFGR